MSFGSGSFGFSEELIVVIQVFAAFLVVWFTNMALTGWLASRRGRDGGPWAVGAFFVGPVALVSVLALPRKPRAPENEPADIPPANRVRLASDAMLEVDVDHRLVMLPGEIGPRVDGRPSFKLAGASTWQWSDGRQLTDDEQAHLAAELPTLSRHEGWTMTIAAVDAS